LQEMLVRRLFGTCAHYFLLFGDRGNSQKIPIGGGLKSQMILHGV
jgi:hypothetical protein